MSQAIPFHENTQQLMDSFIASPTASCIIVAESTDTAKYSTEYLTGKLLHGINKSHILHIKEENGTIGISQIREMKLKMTTKFSDKIGAINRVLVIEKAELMTVEAQNALLKLLEEPPAQTCILLSTINESRLLETIRSRCQLLRILPISQLQAQEYAKDVLGIDSNKSDKAFLLSKGDPILFVDLLHERETSISESINNAKAFLKNDPFDRLTLFNSYDTSEKLDMLLLALLRIAEAGLHSGKQTTRWVEIAESVRETRLCLKSNVSVKLLYMQLSVAI